MNPFEIHDAIHRFMDSEDRRPWLIISVKGTVCRCFPISGQDYTRNAFAILQDHPDFPATGLSKNCFIHDERYYELAQGQFKRYRGKLSGQLL
jgi:hypothetical protein